MTLSPRIVLNSVLGSMAVTVGLWMLQGNLSVPVTIIIIVALTVGLSWVSPTVAHIWAWSTCLIGLESLAWPFLVMASMADLGSDPPLEEMERVFTAVLFGVFSGVFWMTFAYGIYRKIHHTLNPVEPSPSKLSSASKAKRKKKGQKHS